MTQPLQFFQYKDGLLSSEGVPLTTLLQTYSTPLYAYSSQGFLKPLQELQSGLKGLDSMICFALKSNSNLSIIRLLSEAGAGMDLVTGGELYRAMRAEVPAEHIVFSGVGKTRSEISEALEYSGSGIFSFNVESAPELHAINETALKLGKVASVALRYNPDVDPKTHPYISTGLKKNKFGMDGAEILKVIATLPELKGIRLRGISIHIGSQLTSFSPLNDAFGRLSKLVKQINSLLPEPLAFVDLGGGVGITYKNEKVPPIKRYTDLIRKHFGPKTGKPRKVDQPQMKILIEPGRSISGNAGVLLTRVLYRKKTKNKEFLIVDAGMNDLMRPALYQSYHEIVPVKKPSRGIKMKKFDLVGPVCESADCFASDRLLPDSIQAGDLLAILSAGAYGFTMASNYNTRPRPAEMLIENGSFRVIRESETYADLVRGEKF